jgi:hypothetical protein
LLILAGCIPGESQSGTLFYVDTKVSFVSADGRPLSGESVFVAETIGMLVTVTKILKTDAEGSVRLDGRYCGPLAVGANGGYADIRTHAPKSRYTVTVSADRSPSFARLFGTMPADIASRNQSNLYRDCG